ncbi:flagellar motor protein MotB [bacterium]|nr:flagellar motor protein MotB [bacterium]
MAREKKQDCPPPGAPAWVVTYGDMMSLLLTFFVLIVSFSSIEQVKFKAAISSIQDGLGIWPDNSGILTSIQLFQSQTEQAREAAEIVEELTEFLEANELQDLVEVYNTPSGVRLIISDPVLFESGRALIKDDFARILNGISELIGNRKFSDIKVEGHTDNLPIRTDEYPSNWELSADRALSVVKYMAFEAGMDPAKLSAVGYGEYRPRASNDTPEGRGQNRRVEIFLELQKDSQEN